jgi:hypothetical protein
MATTVIFPIGPVKIAEAQLKAGDEDQKIPIFLTDVVGAIFPDCCVYCCNPTSEWKELEVKTKYETPLGSKQSLSCLTVKNT